MSTDFSGASRPLPEHPNLRHLKDQARDFLRAGGAETLSAAQLQVARMYGFASWPKLKEHVEMLGEVGELKEAIDGEDVERVKALMKGNRALHRAPMGYRKNGPLTWVAECRVPWRAPSAARLEMARWMLENGSDVHQGGDGPLMRAALNGMRVAMMELLVSYGADVNGEWGGSFPIIFAPCETVDAGALRWLLEHGARPNCAKGRRALDYVIGSYARSPELGACIEMLAAAGGETKYECPAVLDILCGRVGRLAERVDAEGGLLEQRFGELDFGTTGERMLTLRGGTLLHVAAEYGNVEAVRLVLDRGADVNARAAVDEKGVGGQTALFHAVTQFGDRGLAVGRLLLERGADLAVRAKLPGHYERKGEVVEGTALGYARRFPEGENACVGLLEGKGGESGRRNDE